MLTDRTELRLVTDADIAWVVDLLEQVAVDKAPVANWRDEAAKAIRAMMQEYTRVGYGDYLVRTRETGAPIGYAGFRSLTPKHDEANIAVTLEEAHRGRGLGRELLTALMARAPELGIRTLHAFIRPENVRSVTLFTQAGFRFEGMTQNEQQLTFQHFTYRS